MENYILFNVYTVSLCSKLSFFHKTQRRNLETFNYIKLLKEIISLFHTILSLYVTLDHKTSLSRWDIFVAIAKNTLYGPKLIDFSFMPKIIRILSKDYFVNFLP